MKKDFISAYDCPECGEPLYYDEGIYDWNEGFSAGYYCKECGSSYNEARDGGPDFPVRVCNCAENSEEFNRKHIRDNRIFGWVFTIGLILLCILFGLFMRHEQKLNVDNRISLEVMK